MSRLRRKSSCIKFLCLSVLWLPLPGCGEAPPVSPGAPAEPPLGGAYGPDGALPPGGVAPASRPSLLVVLVDQLRWDAWPPGALPAAASFEHAVTPAPEPTAALASLLTGQAPWHHRVSRADPVPRLEPGYVTLPEILRRGAGYATRAFVADDRLGRASSLWQGADVAPERTGLFEAPEALAAWLGALPAGAPFFALVHADEASAPYGERNHVPRQPAEPREPPEPLPLPGGARFDLRWALTSRPEARYAEELARRRGGEEAVAQRRRRVRRLLWQPPSAAEEGVAAEAQAWQAAYREGAAWTLGLVQALLGRLDALGRADDTVVLVTSTGGTAFLEHGLLGAGRQLYDEQVRIPFLLGGPGPWRGRGALEATASLVDVLPTVLDLLGLPPLHGVEGRSLLPALRGVDPVRPVLAEERQDVDGTGDPDVRASLVALRSPAWKVIVRYDLRAGTVVEEAYDLRADPVERADLAQGGRVSQVPFDAPTCAAVERVRDGLWGAVEAVNRTGGEIYSAGQPVKGERPPPCRPR